MKQLFILLALFIAGTAGAQADTAGGFRFAALEFNFGSIPQGKPVYHSFEARNVSGQPLKIDAVTASCGCTTPEWPKEPIAPGATARIRVGFNAAAEGPFEKDISVAYNGSPAKRLKIKGSVWKAPAAPAPPNASIQLLKQIHR